MKRDKLEMETVILYNEAEDTAEVYTQDPKLIIKLGKLTGKYPDQFIRDAGEPNRYKVPKSCVSVREPYSEERRKKASERAKTAGYRPPNRDIVSEN